MNKDYIFYKDYQLPKIMDIGKHHKLHTIVQTIQCIMQFTITTVLHYDLIM